MDEVVAIGYSPPPLRSVIEAMPGPLVRPVLFATLIVGGALADHSSALAQAWAEKMFETRSHDFRSVGRGAKAEYRFEFKNLYQEDVHVMAVRTSCGCTTPRLTKEIVRSHEVGEVIATFNTDSFVGQKSAVITVVFDRPYYAEVQLQVSGFIRTDITFDPPEVNFGELRSGQAGTRQVTITHRGNPTWRITDVRSHCQDLLVRLDPPQITAGPSGEVQYRMQVKLGETFPEGDIHERLTLISNDAKFPMTEMSVTGRVRPTLSVSPASISLGTVSPGSMVEKRLVVQGDEPFAIRDVACADGRFEFDYLPEGRKKIHFLKVRFRAESEDQIAHRIRVQSDLPGDKSATFLATGTVKND